MKTRTEVEIDSNIDAPIRIHKYNLDDKQSDEDQQQDIYEANSQESPSQFDSNNDVSNSDHFNDLLDESLDNIQNNENQSKDSNYDSDAIKESDESDETNEDNDQDSDEDYKVGLNKRNIDYDNSVEQDQDQYYPQLSLLGLRKKRPTFLGLEPNELTQNDYYQNKDYDDGNFSKMKIIYTNFFWLNPSSIRL